MDIKGAANLLLLQNAKMKNFVVHLSFYICIPLGKILRCGTVGSKGMHICNFDG